eukprot:TRINITY_DN2363_c0_g1_i1.p1 TRINITY_DN2363_c0_g1~~TRINITY_DN2363_c0_g1_i1.p1  ORF type:complete len:301 (+),score=43.25 TRINITY_DN2363_c0_g1_i1:262-1164(+)
MNQAQVQQQQQPKQENSSISDNIKKEIVKTLAQNVVNDMIVNETTQNKKAKDPKSQSCFGKMCSCLTIEFYQPYFDVTTNLVFKRMKAALYPFNNTFFEIENGFKSDLYGPFWISVTLAFCLAAAGNLSQYLQASSTEKAKFTYNFTYVTFALSIVFTFLFGVPIALSVLMKIFGSNQITFFQNLCMYGYATTCYIPVAILCSLPGETWQWFLQIYAAANSTLFLLCNYNKELNKYIQNKRLIVMLFLIGAQCVLLLVYKLYFFKNTTTINHLSLLTSTSLYDNMNLKDANYSKELTHNG